MNYSASQQIFTSNPNLEELERVFQEQPEFQDSQEDWFADNFNRKCIENKNVPISAKRDPYFTFGNPNVQYPSLAENYDFTQNEKCIHQITDYSPQNISTNTCSFPQATQQLSFLNQFNNNNQQKYRMVENELEFQKQNEKMEQNEEFFGHYSDDNNIILEVQDQYKDIDDISFSLPMPCQKIPQQIKNEEELDNLKKKKSYREIIDPKNNRKSARAQFYGCFKQFLDSRNVFQILENRDGKIGNLFDTCTDELYEEYKISWNIYGSKMEKNEDFQAFFQDYSDLLSLKMVDFQRFLRSCSSGQQMRYITKKNEKQFLKKQQDMNKKRKFDQSVDLICKIYEQEFKHFNPKFQGMKGAKLQENFNLYIKYLRKLNVFNKMNRICLHKYLVTLQPSGNFTLGKNFKKIKKSNPQTPLSQNDYCLQLMMFKLMDPEYLYQTKF